MNLGAQQLTLSNATGLYSGVINGTGSLALNAGTETLSSVNTYTGTTAINNGATLTLSGNGSIAIVHKSMQQEHLISAVRMERPLQVWLDLVIRISAHSN